MALVAPSQSSGIDYDFLFKVILIGDANVGKSSLISQFCNDKFMDTVASTVGVDFYIKDFNINNKKVKIKIWDTAGSEKYMSVATAYYRKADGVILVFDVTNEKSFVNIQSRWMDAIMSEDWGCPEAIKLLVGNKSDLSTEVNLKECKRFADLHDMSFIEASARHNLYVAEVFYTLAQQMCELKMQRMPTQIPHQNDQDPSIRIPTVDDIVQSDSKSSSCTC